MQDMKMQARGASLKGLVGAMEEDDAKSIPQLVIRISATPEGIEIEKGNPDGTFTPEDQEKETPQEETGEIESNTPAQEAAEMESGKTGSDHKVDDAASQDMGAPMPEGEGDDSGRSAFEMLIEKKKKEKEGRGGY